MARIIENSEIELDNIPQTKLPRLKAGFESKLNIWAYNKQNKGHEILEKIMTLLGDYSFDKKFVQSRDNKLYLRTTDGKYIQIAFLYGDIDEMPQLIITEGDIVTFYDALYSKSENRLFIETNKQRDNKKQMTQLFNRYSDYFILNRGDVDYIFDFKNPGSPKPYGEAEHFLVDQDFKDGIINLEAQNITDYYNYIVKNISPEIKRFLIVANNAQTMNTTDKIEVLNNNIIYIKLTKQSGKGTVTVEEDLTNNAYSLHSVNCSLNLMTDYDEFQEQKNQLIRKLKKEDE